MANVYRFRHKKTEEIIYVGKTKRSIESRINEHFGGKGHLPKECYASVGRIEYLPMKTEADALFIENYFINKYKPVYNTKDKVESQLTYNMDIKENWKLFCVMNEYENRFKLSNIIDIVFWGGLLYFFILALIGIYG